MEIKIGLNDDKVNEDAGISSPSSVEMNSSIDDTDNDGNQTSNMTKMKKKKKM